MIRDLESPPVPDGNQYALVVRPTGRSLEDRIEAQILDAGILARAGASLVSVDGHNSHEPPRPEADEVVVFPPDPRPTEATNGYHPADATDERDRTEHLVANRSRALPSREALRQLASELLAAADAAQMLGVSPQRFHQLVEAGAIEPAMVVESQSGRAVRLFAAEDITLMRQARDRYPSAGRGPYSCWTPLTS